MSAGMTPGRTDMSRTSLAARLLAGTVRAYQLVLSPLLPVTCRYGPSCSEYAIEALARHGAWRGGWLTVKRFGRCHPLGGHGFDPVPETIPGAKSETGQP